MNIDYSKIIDAADTLDVAEYFGIETYRKGGHTFILCPEPEHNDTRPNNCTLTKKGYYCFACGGKGNLIKMISNFLGIPYSDAALRIANMYGGIQDFSSESDIYEFFPLTNREISAIGLCEKTSTVLLPKAFTLKKPYGKDLNNVTRNKYSKNKFVKYEIDETGIDSFEVEKNLMIANGYILNNSIPISLKTLYREDKEAFDCMVIGKAVEYYNLYKKCLVSENYKVLFEDGIQLIAKESLIDRIKITEKILKRYNIFPKEDIKKEIKQKKFINLPLYTKAGPF